MLYQFWGGMGAALPPDWMDNVKDELLCEDIALCVAGDRRKWLADAGQLAERLRSLRG